MTPPDGRNIVVITKDDQEQPSIKASLAEPTQEPTRADIASAPSSSPQRWRTFPVAEEKQEDPHRPRPRRSRNQITYRREVESIHPYLSATGRNPPAKTRSPTRIAHRPIRRHPSRAGPWTLRFRPPTASAACKEALQRPFDHALRPKKYVPTHHDGLHKPSAGPSLLLERAQGQALGRKIIWGDLVRRRRSPHQAEGHGPEALRGIELRPRHTHPAPACRPTAAPVQCKAAKPIYYYETFRRTR